MADPKHTAAFLAAMRRQGRLEDNLPSDLVPDDLPQAYAAQARLVELLQDSPSDRLRGYKVACTSKNAQDQVGIGHPIYGRILSNHFFDSPASVSGKEYFFRMVEAEFAFRIGTDVPARPEPYTAETIAPHIDGLLPSFELVDQYWRDWSLVGPLVMAADNAFHGAWIRGRKYEGDWRDLDLAGLEVTTSLNGRPQSRGSGAAVLGHPLNVTAWLANELPRRGLKLTAGDYVTTGVCTGVVIAAPGDAVAADFGPLGRVELSVV